MDAQKDIIDTNSQAIRQYLQDNLVIFLADGLHTICTKQPDDPVDSLAEYLFKRSLDVKYPDPTEYWHKNADKELEIERLMYAKFATCKDLYLGE